MNTQLVLVEALRYVGDRYDLSDFATALEIALDQRRFGPRRLLVVTCDLSGGMVGLAHCNPTEPPELAVGCCLDTLDDGAPAALAYRDEIVSEGRPGPDLEERFWAARAVALQHGVHLVDWIICDDLMYRSIKLGLDSEDEDEDEDDDDDEENDEAETDWWDVPIPKP
jgi:hypothetical protein